MGSMWVQSLDESGWGHCSTEKVLSGSGHLSPSLMLNQWQSAGKSCLMGTVIASKHAGSAEQHALSMWPS